VRKDLKEIFNMAKYHSESRLSGDIWQVIKLKKDRMTSWKIIGYSSLSILSLSGSAISIKSLIEESNKLGFFKYFSLAFSDSGIIATYWREYTLSLVDSLPVISIIISLFLVFVLLLSIERLFSQLKNKLLTI